MVLFNPPAPLADLSQLILTASALVSVDEIVANSLSRTLSILTVADVKFIIIFKFELPTVNVISFVLFGWLSLTLKFKKLIIGCPIEATIVSFKPANVTKVLSSDSVNSKSNSATLKASINACPTCGEVTSTSSN